MPRPRTRSPAILALLLCSALSLPTLARRDDPGREAEPKGAQASPSLPRGTVAEKIVVTANRQETPADEVGSSVTVITAEEIEARRAHTVADLLRTVPGVEVARNGGSGQVTSVFVRGGSSSHTLVLLDGARVNSTTTGAFDFADLATDRIERIEIVRGPQSTLYGSEAVAGVVSITTRRGAAGLHGSALAEAGGFGHRRYRLGVDGAAPRFDFSLSYSDLETDSVSAAASGVEDDPHESSTLAGRAGFAFAGDGRLDVHVRAFRGDVAVDGFDFASGRPVDDLDRIQERDGVIGSVRLEKAFGRVTQKLVVGFHDDELTGIDPGDVFSNFTIGSRSAELTAQTDLAVTEDDVLTLGVAYEERRGASAGNFDEKLDVGSLFVQNVSSWNETFFLTAGARHDEHSEFGGETTFRLAGAWKLAAATRLHGSFGTGFKAPTLNDLFFPFFSNPDLAPERSRSFDLGVEHAARGGEVTVDVTVFDTDFDDLIVFDFATFLPQNLGAAASRGVEVAFDYRPGPRFQLAASYTWNETEEAATGRPLPRRPKSRGTVALALEPTEKLRVAATLIAVADRVDSDGSVMDDYERVDLTLQVRLAEHYEPYVRVENLFDEDYEEVNGFTSPGAQAVVGMGIRW